MTHASHSIAPARGSAGHDVRGAAHHDGERLAVRPRIVVVEDEVLTAFALEEAIESMGYDVPAIAGTASDAVRAARQLCPDLVLMDIRLRGERTGIDAALEIRMFSDIPIVFVSAHADGAIRRHAETAAPAGFLGKPYSDRELQRVIERALSEHAAEA